MLRCILLAVIVLTLASATLSAAAKPNIVIIFTDDVGWGDITANRTESLIPTPNIDALLTRGRRCLNGYVVSSICAPSRAGLMTGRQPCRFGITANQQPLPLGERTLAEVLQSAGYATACIGKWHLSKKEKGRKGTFTPFHPTRRGFDVFDGGIGHSINTTPSEVAADVDKGLSFLRKHQRRPAFLHLALGATHTPLTKKDPTWLKRVNPKVEHERRDYAACLLGLDAGIGRFIAGMDAAGLWKNTLVWFVNDNGGKGKTSNTPMRGGKYTLYEGGIRVPFAVIWDDHLPAKNYTGLISSLDIFPTCLAAAGVTIPTDRLLDGKNVWSSLLGKTEPDPKRCLYWKGLDGGGAPMNAIRCGRWKCIDPGGGKMGHSPILYDLERDIGETTNVAAKHPQITKQMHGQLMNWLKSTVKQ